ncbi:hypothetical protein [Solirubrobacter soli]|uniref:hypothetical protein n=1 Tax=Solirubrobacter soli TaxID=363832 RepID=UPI0004031BB6|nr:hypothetical protein [Solirubrobacter soli]
MSWCWLDLVDSAPERATAVAAAFTLDGTPAGWLAAWRQRARPTRGAVRIDDRVVDSGGDATWISLARPPRGVRLPFDDPAVQSARRRVLAGLPPDAVTTFLTDASHFEGALTARRNVSELEDDPFARIFPARILRLEAGLIGRAPLPCGPTIERYGSEQPWPWDRYAAS